MWICSNCGQVNEEKFCSKCGTPMPAPTTDSPWKTGSFDGSGTSVTMGSGPSETEALDASAPTSIKKRIGSNEPIRASAEHSAGEPASIKKRIGSQEKVRATDDRYETIAAASAKQRIGSQESVSVNNGGRYADTGSSRQGTQWAGSNEQAGNRRVASNEQAANQGANYQQQWDGQNDKGNRGSKSSKKALWAGISAAAVVVVIAIVLILVLLNREPKEAEVVNGNPIETITQDSDTNSSQDEDVYEQEADEPSQASNPTPAPTQEPEYSAEPQTTSAPAVVPTEYVTNSPPPTMDSGSCGGNVQWVLSYDGTITISGNGAMYDYGDDSDETPPWFSYRNDIMHVVIDDGVTRVGDYAFRNCSKVRTISIGSGVQVIGKWAFNDCDEVESVKIPGSVDLIDQRAFWGCNRLYSVELGEGIGTIHNGAFADCPSLTKIYIPASVHEMGAGVFQLNDRMTSIEVSSNNDDFVSVDGVLFWLRSEGWVLMQYPAGKSGSYYEISDRVYRINNAAFSGCKNLVEVDIPSSVDILADYAFHECDKLEYVTFYGAPPELWIDPGHDIATPFNGCDRFIMVLYNDSYYAWEDFDGWWCGVSIGPM
ncbi:MAG: leucine-rich repeat protein [Clostridia bacterium]|nr:leucine-rich repeat protein [Clostridia bacterium]